MWELFLVIIWIVIWIIICVLANVSEYNSEVEKNPSLSPLYREWFCEGLNWEISDSLCIQWDKVIYDFKKDYGKQK